MSTISLICLAVKQIIWGTYGGQWVGDYKIFGDMVTPTKIFLGDIWQFLRDNVPDPQLISRLVYAMLMRAFWYIYINRPLQISSSKVLIMILNLGCVSWQDDSGVFANMSVQITNYVISENVVILVTQGKNNNDMTMW